MSHTEALNVIKRTLHDALVLALNNEYGDFRPIYKVDFAGDIYKPNSSRERHQVTLSTSCDLFDHSVRLYLSNSDHMDPFPVKVLRLDEDMLNLFTEYNALLYKQAILNEQKREEYERKQE